MSLHQPCTTPRKEELESLCCLVESFQRKKLLLDIDLLTSYEFFLSNDALFVPLLHSSSQTNYDHSKLSIISIIEIED